MFDVLSIGMLQNSCWLQHVATIVPRRRWSKSICDPKRHERSDKFKSQPRGRWKEVFMPENVFGNTQFSFAASVQNMARGEGLKLPELQALSSSTGDEARVKLSSF